MHFSISVLDDNGQCWVHKLVHMIGALHNHPSAPHMYPSGSSERPCMQSSWSTSALLWWGCTSPSSSARSQLEFLCSVGWSQHSCTTSFWLCSSGWQQKPSNCTGSWCLCLNQTSWAMSASPWQYAGVGWCIWRNISMICTLALLIDFVCIHSFFYSGSCLHCDLLLGPILPQLHPWSIVRALIEEFTTVLRVFSLIYDLILLSFPNLQLPCPWLFFLDWPTGPLWCHLHNELGHIHPHFCQSVV